MDLGERVSGPKAKKSQKSLEKSPGAGLQKSEKSLENVRKVKKSLMGFWRLSDLFRDFFRTFATRLFRDFFESFWLLAPRLALPGPRNLNPRPLRCVPFLLWGLSVVFGDACFAHRILVVFIMPVVYVHPSLNPFLVTVFPLA